MNESRPIPTTAPGRWTQPPPLETLQQELPGFRLERLLGRGGMGAVYQAVDLSLGRAVAVKVLPAELMEEPEALFAERFELESRTMARLDHPGIVRVYDSGRTAGGLLYFVMEYVDGTDLSRLLHEAGRLAPERAVDLVMQICDALAAAHRAGITHRDIKPANILLTREGRVKIADFGLARHQDAAGPGLTKSNVTVGTPDYLAPEAWVPGTVLDGRADLFAVGVVFYQMLTGQVPRGLWSPASEVAGTDPRFDAVVDKAMQPDRAARYATAPEIIADLAAIQSSPAPEPAAAAPGGRRKVLMTAVAVTAAAAALAWGAHLLNPAAPARPGRRPTVVTNTLNAGPGSLREAMDNCDANPGPDTITFAPELAGKTITVTSPALRLAGINALTDHTKPHPGGPIHIDASGLPGGVTVELIEGLFFSPGDTASLKGITITGCRTEDRIAINNFGHLSLTDCTLTGNTSSRGGGALYNLGTGVVEAVNCRFTGNACRANGGAIQNLGSMSLTRCHFSGNKAAGSGGAIAQEDGSLTMTGCTFSDNEAAARGGAVDVVQGRLTARRCTILHNATTGLAAPVHGAGGLALDETTQVTLEACLVAENTAATGLGPDLWNRGGTLLASRCFIGNNKDSSLKAGDPENTTGTPAAPLPAKQAPADAGAD